jgi:hypothetical protein
MIINWGFVRVQNICKENFYWYQDSKAFIINAEQTGSLKIVGAAKDPFGCYGRRLWFYLT